MIPQNDETGEVEIIRTSSRAADEQYLKIILLRHKKNILRKSNTGPERYRWAKIESDMVLVKG